MITLAEVEKLGRVHTVEPAVLSVYLNVPRSPAQLLGPSARVDELVAAAARAVGRSDRRDPRPVLHQQPGSCRTSRSGRAPLRQRAALMPVLPAGLTAGLLPQRPRPGRFCEPFAGGRFGGVSLLTEHGWAFPQLEGLAGALGYTVTARG